MKYKNQNNLPIVAPHCKQLQVTLLGISTTQKQARVGPKIRGRGRGGRKISKKMPVEHKILTLNAPNCAESIADEYK